ncbi:MAG: hypothetical protein KDC12_00465 [Flavobacteriales bacterium]|nr:hypothetical protein [Flavobacteriales bacterium]
MSTMLAQGQMDSSTTWISEHFSVQGYVKYLTTASFSNADDLLTHQFFHNRINFKYYATPSITLVVENRNRVFFGETVKLTPDYGALVDQSTGTVDLSWLWMAEKSIVGHSTLDRAYVQYSKGDWDVSVGRQRINWGINVAWNPNDLFNAYNLVDFDYQERPGSDAVRVRHYMGRHAIEVAAAPDTALNTSVIGLLYKVNVLNYDLQFLAANYRLDYAVGGGWAGNLKNAGFKGEATYFIPKTTSNGSKEAFAGSLSVDYLFRKGLYINVSGLYNSIGERSLTAQSLAFQSGAPLSAKNLMPSRFTSFIQLSGAFTPAFSGALSAIYLHEMDISFLMPSVAYNINNSWDIDLTGQLYFGDAGNGYRNLGNALFLRVRLSY